MKLKRIVTFGGGKGQPELLRSLKTYPVHLSAVVSMMDSGGSSGILREKYGIVPPGDLRRCIAALAEDEAAVLAKWEVRDENNHAVGNLELVEKAQELGSMQAAADSFLSKFNAEYFATAATVDASWDQQSVEALCVTEELGHLVATFSDGTTVRGEHEIDLWQASDRSPDAVLQKLSIEPTVHTTERVREAIAAADLIVLSMGDLFTSMLPTLLVEGVVEAIAAANTPVVAICNRSTKPGETAHFTTEDFANTISQYLAPATLRVFIVDEQSVPVPEGVEPTRTVPMEHLDLTVISADLADATAPAHVSGQRAAEAIMTLL